MGFTRRGLIKAGLFGGAAATGLGNLTEALAAHEYDRGKLLNILVLGGTGFIGPHMVREALRRGHSVTLFNRGRSNNELFPDLETIIGDRDGGLDGLEGRKWDAVIDNSGYVPRHVRDSARLLSGNVGFYLFISTVAVYADFKKPVDEDSPLATLADETVEDVTGETYGGLKVLCERRAREEIGGDRCCVLRPTYICGPGDHTDRFSYWVVRTALGGEMLWPGRPERELQIIDVRDLANFTIDCVQHGTTGTYNTVTPVDAYHFGQLLEDSRAVTDAAVTPFWVDEEFVAKHDVAQGGALPIWHPESGDNAMIFRISGARASAAGLHNRPVRETARDLMSWWNTLPAARRTKLRAGLTAEREAELLALWKAANA